MIWHLLGSPWSESNNGADDIHCLVVKRVQVCKLVPVALVDTEPTSDIPVRVCWRQFCKTWSSSGADLFFAT